FGISTTPESYYFSRYPTIWGWATWARAWDRCDLRMSRWPGLKEQGWLNSLSDDPVFVAYWSHVLQSAYEGMDTWDYAFLLACWVNGGLTAVPAVNLVSNIGFRPDATHTN